MRNEKNMPHCTSTSAITSLSHSYQNKVDHSYQFSLKDKNIINAAILTSTHLEQNLSVMNCRKR